MNKTRFSSQKEKFNYKTTPLPSITPLGKQKGFVIMDLQTKRPQFLQLSPTMPHDNRFNFQARKDPLDNVKLNATVTFPFYGAHKTTFLDTTIGIHTQATYEPNLGAIKKSVPFSKMRPRKPLVSPSPWRNELIPFQNIEKYKSKQNDIKREPVRLMKGVVARTKRESEMPGYLDNQYGRNGLKIISNDSLRMNNYKTQRLGSISTMFSPKANSSPASPKKKRQTLAAHYKSQTVDLKEPPKAEKKWNTFNQLLVEHGFVSPEDSTQPRFSSYNPAYNADIVIESANPHKYQNLQGFVQPDSSDSEGSAESLD